MPEIEAVGSNKEADSISHNVSPEYSLNDPDSLEVFPRYLELSILDEVPVTPPGKPQGALPQMKGRV